MEPDISFGGLAGGGSEVRIASEIRDDAWDEVLARDPLGQFQQCSAWAESKQHEAWRSLRAAMNCRGQIIGGFQLLWRPSPIGRIGYISKGPVAAGESPALIESLAALVQTVARTHRFRAIIVQPPDFSTGTSEVFDRRGFLPNRIMRVITATLLLDLTEGIDAVRQRMRRRTRQEPVQARKRGITVRVGGRADIPAFFSLMAASCVRQEQTRPNPPTAAAMAALWQAFEDRKMARLTIAEFEKQPVAGLFCISFGNRITLWKKGSMIEHQNRHPMSLLYDEALEWGAVHGHKYSDWAAIDRGMAQSILSDQPLLEQEKASRHFFNLGFGGSPKLLPEASIWIGNRVLRYLYAAGSRFPWVQRVAQMIRG